MCSYDKHSVKLNEKLMINSPCLSRQFSFSYQPMSRSLQHKFSHFYCFYNKIVKIFSKRNFTEVVFKIFNHSFDHIQSSGPEVIKLFSCSAQLRLKFILLINVKMPTIVGILTFISRINCKLWSSKFSISILLGYFGIYEQFKFHIQLS